MMFLFHIASQKLLCRQYAPDRSSPTGVAQLTIQESSLLCRNREKSQASMLLAYKSGNVICQIDMYHNVAKLG